MTAVDHVRRFLESPDPSRVRAIDGDVIPPVNGLTLIGVQPLFVCAPSDLRQPAAVPGLWLQSVRQGFGLSLVQEHLTINAQGFDPHAEPASYAEAVEFRDSMGLGMGYTAYLDGQAAAAGMYLPIAHGATELVGITTLGPLRNRGICASLSARLVRAAFAHGAEVVFLLTDNDIARRVYERIGFHHIGAVREYAS